MPENVNSKKDRFNLSYAIKLIVIGLLMGTVFTVGGLDRVVPITREECSVVETRFVDYEKVLYDGALEEVLINCIEWEQYYIDGVLITEEVEERLSMLMAEDEITLLLHPKNHMILEFVIQGETLLSFEDSIEKLQGAIPPTFYFGLLMFAVAIWGMYRLIKILHHRKNAADLRK